MLLGVFYITPWMLGHEGWYGMDGYREVLFFVPFQQFFLLGPALHFYVHAVLRGTHSYKKNEWLHFIPAAIYLSYSLFIFVADVFVYDTYVFYADGRDKDLDPWYQISGLCFVLCYLVMSLRLYLSYRNRIVQVVSFADAVKLLWVRRFLVSLFLIVVLRLVFFILYPEWGSFGQKWWYYFLFACIFYYLALVGIMHADRTQASGRFAAMELMEDKVFKKPATVEIQNLDEWKQKIHSFLLDDKNYKNPTLTLNELASALGGTPRHVSQVINQGFEMNFNDYINQMRVKALLALLRENKQARFTLLGLALDCGFNSKTTFNRAFRKFTNKSPREYLRQSE